MLSGACESLSSTLARQQERAARDLGSLPGLMGALARVLHLPDVQRRSSAKFMARVTGSTSPRIRVGLATLNAKWFREHFQYDVTADLPRVQCPALAITGSKDIQVLPEHARQIAETVTGPAEYHIIPEMTHILRRTAEAQNTVTLIKLYKKQCQEPIDAELLSILSGWLDKYFSAEETRVGS